MYNTLKNSVRLYGNVGQNPEVKSLDNGNKMAKFTLATSEKYKDAGGNLVEETTWHNLIVFGTKSVDTIEKYVTKGDKLSVEGKLTNRSYEGKDGQKKQMTEIVVNDFLLMGSGKSKGKSNEEGLPF